MLVALIALDGQAAAAAPVSAGDQLLVGVGPGVAAASVAGGRTLAPGVRLVRGDASAAGRLRHAPGIRWVEPNRVFRAADATVGSDGGPALLQWALGFINVQQAWQITVGAPTTVAVLDSGMDVTRSDLAANLWTNPSPAGGDVNGYNALTGTGDVRDDDGHGTAVAGIIGAHDGAAGSLSGVAQDVRLMPVKVLDAHGVGSTATVVAGMHYALTHGARIVNLSVAGAGRSQALEEQIQAAQAAGVMVVAAAGNDGLDIGAVPEYPASYPEPNVIGVSSNGPSGALSSFSNRGGSVLLSAPGEGILTTAVGLGSVTMSGTSASAPEVTGALVLLEAAQPSASVSQLRDVLRQSARVVPGLTGPGGAGTLDVGAAMALIGQPLPTPAAATPVLLQVRLGRVMRARRMHLTVRWKAIANEAAVTRYRLELTGRAAAPARHRLTRHVFPRGAANRRAGMSLRPGGYRWRLIALNAAGHRVASRSGHVRVASPRRPRRR